MNLESGCDKPCKVTGRPESVLALHAGGVWGHVALGELRQLLKHIKSGTSLPSLRGMRSEPGGAYPTPMHR